MLSAARLAEILDAIAGAKVVVVGDVMLDRYVTGSVERVSPEAPIPVLRVSHESSSPGGAANVAEKAASLGAEVKLIGAAGTDEAGGELRELLSGRGVDAAGLLDIPGRPTTVKTRFIARTQQLLRVDRESSLPLDQAGVERLVAAARNALGGADALILEDYAKGVLAGDVASRIIDEAKSAGAAVVVDPSVVPYSRYRGATVITPNESEARSAVGPDGPEAELRDVAARLVADSGGSAIAVTRGSQGISLFCDGGSEIHRPARRVEVFDVTGAGDAVAAAFGAALAAGISAEEAADVANLAGGAVVAQLGPGRTSRTALERGLEGRSGAAEKVLSRDEAARWASSARERGEKIVFTNGCFDILHVGHVKLLEEAAELGDKLIVGLNSDSSVRGLKGPGRPVLGEGERSRMLGALGVVDAVSLFDEQTPLEMLCEVRPDVLVKGADYAPDEVVGAEEVRSWGGRVELVRLLDGISTTSLIERLSAGGAGDGGGGGQAGE